MGYARGTQELQTNKDAHEFHIEHVYLIVAATTLTAAIVACCIEHVTDAEVARGLYIILAGLFVAAWEGWLHQRADARARRRQAQAITHIERALNHTVGKALRDAGWLGYLGCASDLYATSGHTERPQ